jgi:hypothetical protein
VKRREEVERNLEQRWKEDVRGECEIDFSDSDEWQ